MFAGWHWGAAAMVSLLCAGGITATATAGEIATINVAETARLMATGVPVVDVRRADEWRATGVIAGSHLITAFEGEGAVADFVAKVKAAIPPGEPVALVCRSGNRSGQAARLLEAGGYARVYNVQGGIIAWAQHGQPLQPCDKC